MPKHRRLDTQTPWVELSTTPADWKRADPALLAGMLAQLHLIRSFEETVLELAGEGLVHGPAHSSIGQEGGAVGSIIGLRSTDAVNGSHRGHHQFLAKALTHVGGIRSDLTALVTPEIRDVLQKTLAEILGLAQGYCRGRGGSMHLQWFEAGALGTNAIVGGGAPMATGNAWAQKHAGTTDLTINYFGDGAAQIGSVLESMNLAAVWKLPTGFFIENNLYGVSTHVSEITADTRLSVRGQGFGVPGWRVDGMDPLAVHLATTEAGERMRAGEGPAVIEAEVYRFFHQNGPYPGSAFGYRTKDEEAAWRERDPLLRVATEMQGLGLVSQTQVDSVREQARQAMREVTAQLLETDPDADGKRRIRPELWPEPEFVDVGLRGDTSELDGARTLDPATNPVVGKRGKFIDAVSAVMGRRMEQDDRIVVMGEDVHRLGGGTNGATKGLAKRFPERVLPTPISENAFVGTRGRPCPRRPLPPRGRVHVPRLHVGRRRPGFQPDRQGPPHVRRRQPSAARAAHQGRDGLRVRLPAPHGPRGRLRDQPRLADRRTVDGRRLRRPDERRARSGGPGARDRTRRPVRPGRRDPRRPRLPTAVRQGRATARGLRRHDHQLPVDGPPRPGVGRGDRFRRRRHRPALARPRLSRLGDHRDVGAGRPTPC